MDKTDEIAASRFYIGQKYDDFDAFAENARAWDLDFFQLEAGNFEGCLQQCCIGSVQVGRGKFSRRLEQFGCSPLGMRTFVVPVNRDIDLNWRSQDVGGNDLLIFPRSGELASVSNVSFDVLTFSVEEGLLERVSEKMGVDGFIKTLDSIEVMTLPPGASDVLRGAGLYYLDLARRFPGDFYTGRWDEELVEELPRLLVRAVGWSSTKVFTPKARRRGRALKLARDAVMAFAHEPISVVRLCEIAGVSERTLQYAFLEKYEVTPKAYLNNYRLNRVRKMLRRADVSTCQVSDFANELGFWHMGQFAKDYRKLFGVLPSETLRGC